MYERIYLAELNGKYGFVNSEETELVLPIIHDTIIPLYRNEFKYSNTFVVVKNGKHGVAYLSPDDSLIYKADFLYDYIEADELSLYYAIDHSYAYDGYNEGENYLGLAHPEPILIPRLAKRNGKYGFLDADFKEMSAFEFEDARQFSEGYAAVKKNGKYGFVNAKLEVVIPFRYDDAQSFVGDEAVITLNGAQGKINTNDSITLKPQFDEVLWDNSTITPFRLGSKWGILDKCGNIVLSPIYEEIGEYSWQYISVKRDGKYGLVDMNWQEVIPPTYDAPIEPLTLNHIGFSHIVKDGKFGLINKYLQVVCPPLYDKMPVREIRFKRGSTPLEKDGKFGLLDRDGRVMVEPKYEAITWLKSINMYCYYENGLAGVLDSAENVIIPAKFDEIAQSSNELFEVKLNGKTGRYDLNGNEVLPVLYDWVYQNTGYFHVGVDHKKGIATTQGELIIPLQFDAIWMYRDTFGIVHKDGKWGFIDRNGDWIVEPRYDKIKMIRGNEVVVKIDGKCGIVDRNGVEQLPIIYDKTVNIHMLYKYGCMRVTLDGKSGIIDTAYKLIIPIEYDHIKHSEIDNSMRKYNCIFLKKEGKIGMYMSSGKLIPCQYDKVNTWYYIPGNIFVVTKGDTEAVIDSLGNIILPFAKGHIQVGRTSNLESDAEQHEPEVIFIRESGKYHLICDDKGKLIAKEEFTWVNVEKDYGTRFTFKNRDGNYYLSPEKRWVEIQYGGK